MRALLPLLIPLLCGCADTLSPAVEAAIRDSEARIMHRYDELHDEMANGFAMASCTQDMQRMLEEIRAECNATAEMCPAAQVRVSIVEVDQQERFLRLVTHFRHEVVYLAPAQLEVVEARQNRVAQFLKRLRLPKTRFLIISSPAGDGEEGARRRARIARQSLRDNGIPAALIDNPWIYDFKILMNELRKERAADGPMFGEPQREVKWGVWILRVEC